jgi:hypothetical protein
MVHVVVMMVMVMVVMVHRRRGGRRRCPSGGASGCFLRDGVAGEAEREHRGSGEGLDHGKVFLCF